jgi:hypothetical protein
VVVRFDYVLYAGRLYPHCACDRDYHPSCLARYVFNGTAQIRESGILVNWERVRPARTGSDCGGRTSQTQECYRRAGAVSALIVGILGCKKKETPAEESNREIDKKTDKMKKDFETTLDKAEKKFETGLDKAGQKINNAAKDPRK